MKELKIGLDKPWESVFTCYECSKFLIFVIVNMKKFWNKKLIFLAIVRRF